MNLQDFISKYNGKGIDFDGYYGFQCMDLAHQYAVEVNNKDFPGAPAAKDVWTKDCPGYTKIANTPDGVPQPGDIIIWGTGVGAYGHIAVFVNGDANSFTSLDQNWPLGSVCHLQKHNYTGVLGWLRIKQPPVTVTVTTPTAELEAKLGEVMRERDAALQAKSELAARVSVAENQLSDLQKSTTQTINDLTAKNDELQKKLNQINTQRDDVQNSVQPTDISWIIDLIKKIVSKK